jgi:hypothetical protein
MNGKGGGRGFVERGFLGRSVMGVVFGIERK